MGATPSPRTKRGLIGRESDCFQPWLPQSRLIILRMYRCMRKLLLVIDPWLFATDKLLREEDRNRHGEVGFVFESRFR